VIRAEAFRADPDSFLREWEPAQTALRDQVARARELLPDTQLSHRLLLRAAELCLKLDVDGHRGEITIARAARAHAALEGRTEVSGDDVRAVAVMSLRHRLRRDPLEEIDTGEKIVKAMEGILPSSHT